MSDHLTNSRNDGPACTVVVEPRTFFRECVLASLQAVSPNHRFLAFDSVETWAASAEAPRTDLLVLWMSAGADGDLDTRLRQLADLPDAPPVVVMSDQDDVDRVAHVIQHGASGFLPTSMGLDASVRVLDIVRAGCSFVPASALHASRAGEPRPPVRAAELAGLFSARQLAVIKAIRRGLPNKLIAYELAMCESTVKVHVKAIMRKLRAKNRTEVAFLTEDLDMGEPVRLVA